MNQSSIGTKAEKKRSILQRRREVKVDFKGLMVTVLKAGINGAFLQWDDLAENGVELLASLGLKATENEIAGLFILRALRQGIKDLVNSNLGLLKSEPDNFRKLFEQIENALENSEVIIDQEFFNRPYQLPFLKEVQTGFSEWITPLMQNPVEGLMMANRLPEYFADALFNEWQERKQDYLGLKEILYNPFIQAKERQQAWTRYKVWLQKQVQEPVFWEAFSLKEIYINLRGYYEEKVDEDGKELLPTPFNREARGSLNNLKRIVVNIKEEFDQWVAEGNEKDAIRLLTGSPGSGKSSFTKIFAANQAALGRNVLYIPLHRLNFKGSLIEEIGDFFKYGKFLTRLRDEAVTPWVFPENPIDQTDYDCQLLIIFDGLDELSKAGKIGEQTAREFINEVRFLVNDFNNPKFRLRVLISGREVVMQANIIQGQRLYYLLPYYLKEDERQLYQTRESKQEACTTEDMINVDQRDDWWQRYGELKQNNYAGIPEQLKRDNLTDITAQPLLNYLIALSYEREGINFDENKNINEIYSDLLKEVYKRAYEPSGHRIIEGISENEFLTILMEIALAAWHGDGRTTTVKEIETHCESSSLKKLLDKFQKHFQENASASITRLLTAFYFRESGETRESEKTFEFTHKSFGEYLTAKRIVEGLRSIDKKLKASEEDYSDDYDAKKALMTWVTLCGASPIDFAILYFVVEELRLSKVELVMQWQQQICHLIEYLMVRGMPMEALNLPSFKMMMTQSRNAEEALLVVLNACARITKELSVIKWPTAESFGEWIARLVGQRENFEKILVMDCLSYLDLHECNLRLQEFYRANLEEANLTGANLTGANLVVAHLEGANLEGANLEGANLAGTNLVVADLAGANLIGADLIGADLIGANLDGADLAGADLRGANLEGANLIEVDFHRANLKGSFLDDANLYGANLYGANLAETDLIGVNLEGANLEEANLEGANLEDARNLDKANLKGTILEGKNIEEIVNPSS